ncbi:MAG TPA: PmoA family protein, partial [Candidatus Hydrogenedentes bacterium]|nr:PmoA family protein [Candidatus Hydrogenedentota bacterium]
MRTTRQFAACLLVLIALSAWSEGPVVTIRSDHPLRNAPVTVPVPGGIDPSAAYVLKAGKEKLPVTIRENQLITIVPELAAGSEERYTLESAGKNRKPGVSIEQRGTEKVLEIKINGKPFTRYYYGEEWKKPFFWPITVEGGVGLTRDFPMDPKDKPQDHPHHKSMWSAFGNVNGANCWEENPGTGAQKVLDVTWESGDACGRIVSHDEWVDA